MARRTPEFRLSPAALRDLEGIWRYTAQQWGQARAERYVDALDEAFRALARKPDAAPSVDHIRAGYRRQRVERHAVYDRMDGDMVVVMRILHERMDAPRHLSAR
jgi:toxin ParE1/3/4